MRNHDWKNLSRQAGWYGPDVPEDGARVRERHGLCALDGDLDGDVLVGPGLGAVAEQVLVAELEAQLVVDLRQRLGRGGGGVGAAGALRELLEILGREVGRLDADREDADLLALELRDRGVRRGDAADVVAVGEDDDARRAERGAAHLRDRRRERVVEPRPLAELRRLREDRLDLLGVGGQRQGDGRVRVEEHDGERLAGVPRCERARCLHRRLDRPLHAVGGVDQEHRPDALARRRGEHGEVLDGLAVLGDGDALRRECGLPRLGERQDVGAIREERVPRLDDLDAVVVRGSGRQRPDRRCDDEEREGE